MTQRIQPVPTLALTVDERAVESVNPPRPSDERAVDGTIVDESIARHLEREAARALGDALGLANTLHLPGQRDRYRCLLEDAIQHARRALDAAEREPAAVETSDILLPGESITANARCTLARAHAARAEDALHGAGQLSRSAQRAPTRAACDDGWRRVEAIVTGAEASARVAANMATALDSDTNAPKLPRLAQTAAHRASTAAISARRIVDERNDAYTFHTDNGFSFGEGWYLAAAAVLAGVSIQIEPGKPGTTHAETFLRDAGLLRQLRPYRPRPRAMKQVTEIVARAFEADPIAAQGRLRAAFLGDSPIPTSVAQWVDSRLSRAASAAPNAKKVLLWVRQGVHDAHRNTQTAELMALTDVVRRAGLTPLWTGDALADAEVPTGVVDFVLFWKDPTFQQADMRRAQLQFFEHLKANHGLVGQLGVTTAGMDGPALLGLPTIYLTDAPNVRMREWVGAVPGYEEIVRRGDSLDHVARRLSEWAQREAAGG